jgi:hypothetical protein
MNTKGDVVHQEKPEEEMETPDRFSGCGKSFHRHSSSGGQLSHRFLPLSPGTPGGKGGALGINCLEPVHQIIRSLCFLTEKMMTQRWPLEEAWTALEDPSGTDSGRVKVVV